jgi:hypothetical protein
MNAMDALRDAGFEKILLLVFTIYLFLMWSAWPLLKKLAKKLHQKDKEES